MEKSTPTGLKYDDNKLRYTLIPPVALKGLAEVLTFGAAKYTPDNWKYVDNGKVRYLDALYRHLEAYRSGEVLDPESGLSHLKHILTNAAFLLYFEFEDEKKGKKKKKNKKKKSKKNKKHKKPNKG